MEPAGYATHNARSSVTVVGIGLIGSHGRPIVPSQTGQNTDPRHSTDSRHSLDPRQSLDPRTSPKARLGKHLRRLRLAADYTTQAAAAARIQGYGEDSIQKAETGYQLLSDDLYEKLLALYKATDTDRVYLDELLEQARQDKGNAVPEFAEPWLEAEKAADSLWLWAPDMVPGLFQVEEYIRPQFEMKGMPEDEVRDRADARLKRRAILNRRRQPHPQPHVHSVARRQLTEARRASRAR